MALEFTLGPMARKLKAIGSKVSKKVKVNILILKVSLNRDSG